ncbi:glycosyltransferase family 4 protein [Ilumatobacter sp.]|uniref:MraY family glycosyltransferase n=1 Tax=Ilumatobacter sp. TaxID=1967498 RepID=UPI0037500561
MFSEVSFGDVVKPAVLSVSVALVATPLVRHFMLKFNIVDTPNERSSHSVVVPRGGGLAIIIAVFAGLAISKPGQPIVAVAAASLLLGIVGLMDDHSGLSARVRLLAQAAVGAGLCVALLAQQSDVGLLGVAGLTVGIVGFIGFVNAFNFMDGINGISVAQAVVTGVFFVVVGISSELPDVALAGALIAGAFVGFAPFNTPVAFIFLGDAGSYFAGAWLAGVAVLAATQGVPVEVVVLPGLFYIADTLVTLVARFRRGAPIGQSHREHAYQMLTDRIGSHIAVSALVGLGVAITATIGLAVLNAEPAVRAASAFVAAFATIAVVVTVRTFNGTSS